MALLLITSQFLDLSWCIITDKKKAQPCGNWIGVRPQVKRSGETYTVRPKSNGMQINMIIKNREYFLIMKHTWD